MVKNFLEYLNVCSACRWTELHPGLLGVPELSHAIAEYWDSGLRLLDTVIVIRTNNRPKVNQSIRVPQYYHL